MSSDETYDQNENRAALDAGVALAEPTALDVSTPVYSLALPYHGTHALIDTEKFAPAPRRPKGVYRPATVESLIAVVKRYHDSKRTTVWVHPTSGHVEVVFNDNAAAPAWRDHRAVLDLTVTPKWRHWMSRDGQLMTQGTFAEHVEDGVAEIHKPPAADMLELAQTFHAHNQASFRSAIRLQDGTVQVQYDEELDAKAGRSAQMKIPTEFKLAISPFLGEAPYAVTALLRYRVSGGKLSIGYKLSRPDEVVRDALAKIAGRLTDEFGVVFIGEAGQ